MEAGSSIPPAAAGFIPLPFFTGTQDMELFREGTSLAALIHLASSIIRLRLFSFDKAGKAASCLCIPSMKKEKLR
jgi:hypothetical protein